MIKKLPVALVYCFCAALFVCISSASFGQQRSSIKTIIVDAGHGGKAAGAKGTFSYEKDICLDIALKLGKKIEEAFPDVKVLYTRTTDVYTDNRWRADFANSNKGDLFISIHVNAAPKIRHSKFIGYRTQTYYTGKGKNRKKRTRKVPKYSVYYTDNPSHGTETYIWAADRSDEKEQYIGSDVNSPELAGDSTEFTPDINDPEFKAKALLWTKRFFDKSYMLASFVEESFIGQGRFSRGVKQRNHKGIWVLQATSMPSILVETGFITYKSDEVYLNSEKGQEEVAENILTAVKKYKQATERK
jgi:N-acetylmuramoyl-L-alanine amidase